MPDLHKKIIDTSDEKQLAALTEEKIMKRETLIRELYDNSTHSPANLFNTADQVNLNTRLEFICGRYYGLTFRWLRLF
jgi:hypothetical protein